MFRSYLLPALVAALLATGCVQVNEPLSDIEKAEPDKKLLGLWDGSTDLRIEVPEVKGNPKGLMRATSSKDPAKNDGAIWFYTTTINKRTYANIILETESGVAVPDFLKEGEFAKWQKEPKKRYFIFAYKLDGDKLTVDGGNKSVFDGLLKAEKLRSNNLGCSNNSGGDEASTAWLAKYLDKNDPTKLFDGKNANEYTRAKK